MAYNALNNLIDAYIYANGVQAITGQILNGVLKQMVSQLGSGYHLMGVAGPETVPASNDYAMVYFAATAGEYTDFGGITLAAGEVAVLLTSGNGSWSKQTIYNVPTTTEDLENTAGFITNAVTDLVNYYTKEEIDTTLADYPTLEALATALADYYTKTEIDTTLEGYPTKQDQETALGDYYTKDEMDVALGDRYTKSETDTKLDDYYKKTETYDKDEVDSIVATLSRQEYIVAWDGLAAPDVSAIPAGVTVTYSGTTYTGTMAASASTVNKIYMVWNGTAYDMYGTSQDGGFSWVPMGTTTVDLSQYATKAEVSQLEAEVNEKADQADLSQLQHEVTDKFVEIDERLGGTVSLNPVAVEGIMVLSSIATQAASVTNYVPVTQGKPIAVKFTFADNTKWSRRGFTSQIPANGVAVTGYAEGHSVNATITPPIDGYFVISTEIANSFTIKVTKEVQGIDQEIQALQTQVGNNTVAIGNNTTAIGNNATNIAKNTDDIIEIKEDVGLPLDFKETIQSGATSAALIIDVSRLHGRYLNLKINSSPLSGSHSIYRTRGYATGIIDGTSCNVGSSVNIEITSETNYLWVFKAGEVATTSDLDVTVFDIDGISQKTEKIYNSIPFEYYWSGSLLYVSHHSGDKDLVISFGRGGGNNLWDFRGFYTKNHGAKLTPANLTSIHYNGSDWFAPFKIRAINNIDGDDYELNPYNEYFTGGAHQYNNAESGSTPTARGIDTVILIDGKPRTETDGIGHTLKMMWTNYIQAYNTRKADGSGREVLKETITLTYDGIKWDAETVLVPLEDIKLDLWYGYQTTGVGGDMSQHWRFINAVNRGEDPADSGNYNAIGFDTYGGACNVRCVVDNGVDLGSREQVFDNSTQGSFKSGSKLYFLIANKWETINANCNYFLKGTYYIERQ